MSFTTSSTALGCNGGVDDLDTLAVSVYSAVGAISRSTSWPQTGAGCVAHDQTTNGNKAISPLSIEFFTTAGIRPFSFAAAVSATPSSAAGVLYHYPASGAVASGGKRYIRVETDLKLGIYDKLDRLLGKSITTVPSGASGTPQEFTVVFDGLTLSTVWVTIYAGDAVDIAFDTGRVWADVFDTTNQGAIWWGEYLDAGVNHGCTVFIDDGFTTRSTTAGDAPHLAAVPRFRVTEPVDSTTVGNYNAWDSMTNNTVDNANSLATYIDNGELATHDGDTSHLQSTTAGESFTMKSTATNPVPSGATIFQVEQRHVGRMTGGGKLPPKHRHRLSATDVDSSTVAWGTPVTSYVGVAEGSIIRPGGGSWVDTDFASSTLEWGALSNATTPGYRVTHMAGPSVIYYTDTLPLGTTPQSLGARPLERGVGVGVMAGVG